MLFPVLFLCLPLFLHRFSLFGRCWSMYKELWQRAVTALTHACLPSHSLSIAESQTHAHVQKAHSTVALWITHTVHGLCTQQEKYFLFQFLFQPPLCCLSSSLSLFLFVSLVAAVMLASKTNLPVETKGVCLSLALMLALFLSPSAQTDQTHHHDAPVDYII